MARGNDLPSRSAAGVHRVRAEQIRLLYRAGPLGVTGAVIGAALLAEVVVHLGSAVPLLAKIWSVIIAGVAGAHLLLCRGYWLGDSSGAHWRSWA